jgi:hypothetical protein
MRSGGTEKIPSGLSQAAQSRPLPCPLTFRGCPGGLLPFGTLTGQESVALTSRSARERYGSTNSSGSCT